MKEQEPIELTTKPVDSTLKVKEIIMAEGNGGGPDNESPAPINPEQPRDELEGLRTANIDVGVRGAAEKLAAERSTNEPKASIKDHNTGESSSPVGNDESDHGLEALAYQKMISAAELSQATGIAFDMDAFIEVEKDDGVKQKMASVSTQMQLASEQTGKQRQEYVRRLKEERENLQQAVENVKAATELESARQSIKDFIKEAEKIEVALTRSDLVEMQYKGIKSYKDIKEALLSENTSIEDLKGIVDYLSPKLKAVYDGKTPERLPDMPLCLEDLAALIMQRAEDEYKQGGEFELVDETTGKVNLTHFYEWVRHQMWRVHENNPTTETNFFSDEGMGVKTSFRTINFYEIVFTPSFFHEKKSGARGVQHTENPEYEALRQQIYKEAFLFQMMRNGDFLYRDNKSGEKGMMQALEGIYKTNPVTRADFLEFILSLPSMSKNVEGESNDGRQINEKKERNFVMGEAIRRALGSYASIWDYDMVKQYLGENSVFFKKDYAKYDEKGKDTGQVAQGFIKEDWFDSDGNLKPEVRANKKKMRKFMDFMNLFQGPGRDQDELTEIREKMVLAIKEKQGISYSEAKLAEAWAFSLSNFTGIAAMNDLKAIGYEQWTKQGRLRDYRKGQMQERRRAKFGSKYTVKGLKRISLNFFEATRDRNGRAIYEIVQGGQGNTVDIENNPIRTYKDDYSKTGDGYIQFEGKDESGKTVTVKSGAKSYEEKDSEFIFKNEAGGVLFKIDANKQVVPVSGDTVFTNKDNQRVEATGLKPVERPKLRFESDIQRFFVVNHMAMSTEWYDFIINSHEMDFKGMIEGYNFTGKPIINEEKLSKMKDGIRKNIAYALSTWPGTDYTKVIHDWDNQQEVDDKGNLVFDKGGDPTMEIVPKDISILESMFGEEVMHFINMEIESSRRRVGTIDQITGEDRKVDLSALNIDVHNLGEAHDRLTADQKRELKLAIWTGVFTYQIAKEIQGHRDWDSNLKRYGLEDLTDVYNVIRDGEVLYDDEIEETMRDTHTTTRWIWFESFAAGVVGGGFSGLLKALGIFARDLAK